MEVLILAAICLYSVYACIWVAWKGLSVYIGYTTPTRWFSGYTPYESGAAMSRVYHKTMEWALCNLFVYVTVHGKRAHS